MASTYYRQVGSEVEIFETCFRNRLPLLIKGPTGCGKSQFVQAMAERLVRPVVHVSCNEDTTASDLLGRFIIQGMNTVWQDGPVTRAVRQGAILYLDEIAEAREDVVVAIHPLTDHRRELYLDRTNEVIRAPESFFCVASYNPGYQRGLKELKPSTRQRFVGLSMSFPPPPIEAEIVRTVTEADRGAVEKMVQLATKIRSMSQLALRETVSTRLLVHSARLIASGMEPRLACRIALSEPLSDDPKTLLALGELIDLHF